MISKTDVIKCGTCEYWTGRREPVFDAKGNPKVRIDDTHGECQKQESRFCDQNRDQNLKCKYYSKWPELF